MKINNPAPPHKERYFYFVKKIILQNLPLHRESPVNFISASANARTSTQTNRFVNYILRVSDKASYKSFLVYPRRSPNFPKRAFQHESNTATGHKNLRRVISTTLHFNKYVSFIGLYARNSFSIVRVHLEQPLARARAHATSASCHNRADGREAPGRKIHSSALRAGVQLAVPRWKITKKRGELIVATGPRPLRFIIRPSSLYVPSRGFLSIGVLSLPLFLSFTANIRADKDSAIDKRRVTKDREGKEREMKRLMGKKEKRKTEVQRDAEERKARNGNHEKRQRIISIIDPNGRMHARTQNAALASVCAALRFTAAPLTGGLRPSKGCACGYVHNTVHRRMHVGPWMRRRARWLRERETARARARAPACVRVCVTFDVA